MNIYVLTISLIIFQAGIHGDMFSIVFEPEAASVYARLLPVEKFIGENKSTILKTFDPGTKFIVVDAGGKTFFTETRILKKKNPQITELRGNFKKENP